MELRETWGHTGLHGHGGRKYWLFEYGKAEEEMQRLQ